ncbi:M4 family metallopeptidase [Fodinicola acaciae]|uniref:M4 family metallopeptidase n=1 Tax=Fodinicola acaciae TaxID=2681555 RepID=UPI0013D328F2|nr:M4 family metallopeptidase [Fodinicola acaciae]
MRTVNCILPPHIVNRLGQNADAALRDIAAATLAIDARMRDQDRKPQLRGALPDQPHLERRISDAQGSEDLPGTPIRAEGDPPATDETVNEAYDKLGAVFKYYLDVHSRNALDGAGGPLLATVHYGQKYDNAFWDGTQMVFGDGDGSIFVNFTKSLDVVGHELTHGVSADEASGLLYQDQPGALNESISDVFGSMVKQYALGQDVTQADWLIGNDILGPDFHGIALRSMAAPGTAYDDPQLGKDPQPAHMSKYVHTQDDNGGVHINSGIPNKAFHDASVALGGHAWETAGKVWYAALLDPAMDGSLDFATFAGVTVRVAHTLPNGDKLASAVANAWTGVGVQPKS